VCGARLVFRFLVNKRSIKGLHIRPERSSRLKTKGINDKKCYCFCLCTFTTCQAVVNGGTVLSWIKAFTLVIISSTNRTILVFLLCPSVQVFGPSSLWMLNLNWVNTRKLAPPVGVFAEPSRAASGRLPAASRDAEQFWPPRSAGDDCQARGIGKQQHIAYPGQQLRILVP
jgi:hypothetical protein